MDRQASAREKKELKRAQKDLKRAAKQLLKEQKAAEKAARRMSKRLIKSAAKHKDKMPQPELSRDRFSPTPLSTTGSIYSTTVRTKDSAAPNAPATRAVRTRLSCHQGIRAPGGGGGWGGLGAHERPFDFFCTLCHRTVTAPRT